MLLLEDKNENIEDYTLPGFTLDDMKAKIINQVWNGRWVMPTLAYIEISSELRGRGYSYQLLDLITAEHKYLWFLNYNFHFWHSISKNNNLNYKVILRNENRGEIIRKCL